MNRVSTINAKPNKIDLYVTQSIAASATTTITTIHSRENSLVPATTNSIQFDGLFENDSSIKMSWKALNMHNTFGYGKGKIEGNQEKTITIEANTNNAVLVMLFRCCYFSLLFLGRLVVQNVEIF